MGTGSLALAWKTWRGPVSSHAAPLPETSCVCPAIAASGNNMKAKPVCRLAARRFRAWSARCTDFLADPLLCSPHAKGTPKRASALAILGVPEERCASPWARSP
jgi:hypothetical protein